VTKHAFCSGCGQCGDDGSEDRPSGVGVIALSSKKEGVSYLASINLSRYGVPEFVIPDVPPLFTLGAIDIIRELTEHVFGEQEITGNIRMFKDGDTYVFHEILPLKFAKLSEEQREHLSQFCADEMPPMLIISVDGELLEGDPLVPDVQTGLVDC